MSGVRLRIPVSLDGYAAGQDVLVAGGADVAGQYLRAGLVDEMLIRLEFARR
jgi:dihydrofolate reductase